MKIKSIELLNFRNYQNLKLDFHEGTNIFYGDNAQGKTNILESIYLCATAKSHRTNKDKELINFAKEEAHVKLILEKKNSLFRIDIHLKANKTKGIAINGRAIHKISELLGILNIVLFSPEDLNLIKRGPNERRHFLDIELCQLDNIYTSQLANYNKVLTQRNRLLKDLNFHPELLDTLDIWDMQLIYYGSKIIETRKKFIDKLNIFVKQIHKDLTSSKENLELIYEFNAEEENFEAKMKSLREREIRQGISLVGPHRDDLEFLINGIDIRKFGSQGQQRTTALSLKLAEISLIKKIRGDFPVLLLDDVMSELDSHRQLELLDYISCVQTVITCTGLDDLIKCNFPINRLFYVSEGKIDLRQEKD